MEQNSCLQVRLRKDRNTLVVVGAGVIAFGVWSVIKAVMDAAVNIETLLVTRSGERLSPAAFWIALAVIVAIELALRVYVGRSAIAEGRGVKKGALYIVLAILMGLISLLSVVVVPMAAGLDSSVLQTAAARVVELTSGVTILEMAVAAIRVKRTAGLLENGER